MLAQRPNTSTTIALTQFGQSRIEWKQNENREVDDVIINYPESPLQIKRNVKLQPPQNSLQYTLLLYDELIARYRLSEVYYSVRKSKCSCFLFSNTITATEQVKRQFIILGAENFDCENQYHRDTIYTIHCLLGDTTKMLQLQYELLSKNVKCYFQLLQFLSCVEFEKPYFQQLYKEKGFQLIEIMLELGLLIFELLKVNKLDTMIKSQKPQNLFNILRNYQIGLLYQTIYEMQQHNKELPQLIEQFRKIKPIYFLNSYVEYKKNFTL